MDEKVADEAQDEPEAEKVRELAYPGLCSIKQLGVLLYSLGSDAGPSQATYWYPFILFFRRVG
jgi:hypothetical protein